MSWKITALQSLILAGLSYLAIQYFSLNPLNEVQFQQQDLASKISTVEKHVESLDQRLNQLNRTKNERITNQSIRQIPQKNEQESLLSQRIRALEKREKELTEKVSSLVTQQENQLQEQDQPEQVEVHGWLTTLPEEKKSMVKEIYQEQLALMQNRISTSPGDLPPSTEDMLSILQENRAELKTQLEEILTEEEYESFLETLNKTRHPPGLPALNQ